MTSQPTATNTEIDELLLEGLRRNPDGLQSMALGAWLRRLKDSRLKQIGTRPLSDFHKACEHANRSCQRLRKSGKIKFTGKVWVLAGP